MAVASHTLRAHSVASIARNGRTRLCVLHLDDDHDGLGMVYSAHPVCPVQAPGCLDRVEEA
jgi:hypothetical protein